MKRSSISVAILLGVLGAAVMAGPDEVKFPENYQTEFVNYLDVDRYDRKRVRRMYISAEALETAIPGEPLPDGTVLIMEDHDARLGADETLQFDDAGRLIAEEAVGNIFVMEKNSAWSTDNGNWDYAWYLADGTPRPEATFEGCFSCHASRAERDFTFTAWKFQSDRSN